MLKDRVFIVTGASSGMGWAVAKALAADGVMVVLAARSSDKLHRFAKEIEADGGTALAVPTDATDERQVESLF